MALKYLSVLLGKKREELELLLLFEAYFSSQKAKREWTEE